MSDRSATKIQAVVRGCLVRKSKKPKSNKRKRSHRVSFKESVEDNEGETRPLKRVNTSEFFKGVLARGFTGIVTTEYVKELLHKVKQEDMTDKEAAKDLVKTVQDKNEKLIDAMIEDKHVGITDYNIYGGSSYVVDNILRMTRDSLIKV